MGLPKSPFKFYEKSKDGYEYGAYRDRIGNVTLLYWKSGEGFKMDQEFRIQPHEMKRFRDWLTKIIEYQERK